MHEETAWRPKQNNRLLHYCWTQKRGINVMSNPVMVFPNTGEVYVPKLLTEKMKTISAKDSAIQVMLKTLTDQLADLIIEHTNAWTLAHTMADFPEGKDYEIIWDHVNSKITWKLKVKL
jgi:hypothetical protein